jgi:putative addiction module CopG family antidote
MVISLPPELQADVTARVARGAYSTEADVIREALLQLDLRDAKIADLHEKVMKGVEDSEAGRVCRCSRPLISSAWPVRARENESVFSPD